MVFTTYDKSYYVPALVCYDNTICGYCNVKDTEIKKLEKHLTESLTKLLILSAKAEIVVTPIEKNTKEQIHFLNGCSAIRMVLGLSQIHATKSSCTECVRV